MCFKELPSGCPSLRLRRGYAVGRVSIHPPPISAAATGSCIAGKCRSRIPSRALAVKAKTAAVLPLRLIAPRSRHAAKCGFRPGCSTILRSSAGLLRAKHKAVRIISGTVGRRQEDADRSECDAEEAEQLRARDPTTEHGCARRGRAVHMKNLLCDIQADRGNLTHGRLLSDGRSTPPSWHIDAVGGVHPITHWKR